MTNSDDTYVGTCSVCKEEIYLSEYGTELGHADWCTNDEEVVE